MTTTFEQTVVLIVFLASVWRLTHLINVDKITDPFRIAIAERERRALVGRIEARRTKRKTEEDRYAARQKFWNYISYQVNCPWCVSPWIGVALGLPTSWWLGWSIWFGVFLGLAASMVTGFGETVLGWLSNEETVIVAADDDDDDR